MPTAVVHMCTESFLTEEKQGNHLYGNPGNVRDFTKSEESVRDKILSGKSGLKLFIVSCIFASILVISRTRWME